MNRQQIVICLERMNRFSKQLTYWVELGGEFYLPSFDADLNKFGDWAKEVRKFIVQGDCNALMERIVSFPKQDLLLQYLEDHRDPLPKEIFSSLSDYAATISALKDDVKEFKAESKGELCNLVDGLAFKEAADLLQRCVEAGLLTEEYQPMPSTTSGQLKLIAFAVSTILEFKVRKRWAYFEEQWNHSHNKLSGVSLPIRDAEVMEVVTNLFPEVDFTPLFAPKVYLKFDTPYNTPRIKGLYTDLKRGMYLDESTTFEQFLGIFGKGDDRTPVNWIQEQRKLGFFIRQAFAPNNKDYWKKAVSRFRVNGELPHRGSLQSGYQALVKNNLVDAYCPELMDIANKYNRK